MRLPYRRGCVPFVCSMMVLLFSLPAFADPFVDVTVPAGIALNGRNKGVAIADVDGDGFLDMFVSNKGGPSRSIDWFDASLAARGVSRDVRA